MKQWIDNSANVENNYGPIKNWDVSKVTNMYELFINTTFNQDLSWNTSNVTTMNGLFQDSSFNNASIKN